MNLAYSMRNRSAAIRIPTYSMAPNAKRLEFRPADPTCNPYLAFAAMLLAGLDGIQNKIDPDAAGYRRMDENLYEMSPEDLSSIKNVPGSLNEALVALEEDHEFLLKGNVFTRDLLEAYISFKRDQFHDVQLRPTPHEFFLYYDA